MLIINGDNNAMATKPPLFLKLTKNLFFLENLFTSFLGGNFFFIHTLMNDPPYTNVNIPKAPPAKLIKNPSHAGRLATASPLPTRNLTELKKNTLRNRRIFDIFPKICANLHRVAYSFDKNPDLSVVLPFGGCFAVAISHPASRSYVTQRTYALPNR